MQEKNHIKWVSTIRIKLMNFYAENYLFMTGFEPRNSRTAQKFLLTIHTEILVVASLVNNRLIAIEVFHRLRRID
jgi:hypothetical protein